VEIQKQRAGDCVVVLLGDAPQVKEGDNKLALEFRRAADDELVDVGNVGATNQMPMPGMPNMVGETTVTSSGTPGRYTVTCRFPMKGQWNTSFTFANGQKAQFALKTQ
jgi:hypothetical protein